jgi:hypothetical protein
MNLMKYQGMAITFLVTCLGLVSNAYPEQSNCDKNYQDAVGHYNNKRYDDAMNALNASGGCPDSIRSKAEDLKSRIKAAIQCGALADNALRQERSSHSFVCAALAKFEGTCLPDSRIERLKARIGPCNLAPPEADQLYNDAQAALNQENQKLAKQKLRELSDKYPSYPDAGALREQIIEADEKNKPKAIPSPVKTVENGDHQGGMGTKGPRTASTTSPPVIAPPPELPDQPKPVDSYWNYYSAAEHYFKNNELYRARDSALEALRRKSSDEQTRSLLQEINKCIEAERKELRQAILYFHNGQYDESYRLLSARIATEKISPQAAAISEFYLGANDSTRFILGGGGNMNLHNAALEHFRNSVKKYQGFNPPKENISERVLQLFVEATQSNQSQ